MLFGVYLLIRKLAAGRYIRRLLAGLCLPAGKDGGIIAYIYTKVNKKVFERLFNPITATPLKRRGGFLLLRGGVFRWAGQRQKARWVRKEEGIFTNFYKNAGEFEWKRGCLGCFLGVFYKFFGWFFGLLRCAGLMTKDKREKRS